MFIECRLGAFTVETVGELVQLVKNSVKDSLDDIWISASKEEQYPSLAILANHDIACVHYFSGQEMFQSKGTMAAEGYVVFAPGGERSEMPAYVSIPLRKALECVRAFFATGKRPDCIQWNDL